MALNANFDLPRWHNTPRLALLMVTAGVLAAHPAAAQPPGEPYATLLPAVSIVFPNETDSNSPAVWEVVDGRWTLSLFNSVAGIPQLSRGPSVQRLRDEGHVRWASAAPHGGVWIESVIRDADSWYAFYHNEREGIVCAGSGKVWPRIGAARSDDRGATWTDLGPLIETPADTVTCDTRNHYFVGGVGDFSVVLDGDRAYAYIHYTQYVEAEGGVGVSVARMAWADRDQPAGRVDVWNDGVWLPPTTVRDAVTSDENGGEQGPDAPVYEQSLATPIFPADNRWDDGRDGVDVLWGPSIHWNTALESYVMLLNKATSDTWDQGGVLVSFNPRLDDPSGWTTPALLWRGGSWYPQVIGLDPTAGTDSYAGAIARFYMSGTSEHLIVFGRR